MRNVARGLENKIIELQQKLDEKVSWQVLLYYLYYYCLACVIFFSWFDDRKYIQPVESSSTAIIFCRSMQN